MSTINLTTGNSDSSAASGNHGHKITPCLWFDDHAEEAVKFYTTIFKSSKIEAISYYGDDAAEVSGRPKGSVMTITFQLDGHEFMALNGGPVFTFSPAVSFMVNCTSQQEVDYFWEKLTADGGEPGECGWLKDRFGVSWQIVPIALGKLLQDKDPARSQRVMQALLQMQKIEVDILQQAYDGR